MFSVSPGLSCCPNYWQAFNWDSAYSFKGLVHEHCDGKQTAMALEQQLGALHPDSQAACKETEIKTDIDKHRQRNRETDRAWHGLSKPQSPPPVIYFLHQGHTYSFPNNLTPDDYVVKNISQSGSSSFKPHTPTVPDACFLFILNPFYQ